MKNDENLELYAIQNSNGQWFRRKGYGGYGNSWVDSFAKARIYTRPGAARGVIAYFAKDPKYPVPNLVVLKIGSVEILDETARIEKSKKAKEKRELKNKLQRQQVELERARRDFEEAKSRLERIQRS